MADGKKPLLFGKKPLRSLETFGVAGLLSEKSRVFYSSVFTTKHVGRVTDLVAAKLLDEGLDELKLRALLLFGTFEVFRSQAGATENTSRQRLAEPLVIECGLDDDKVAIGISFTTDEDHFPRLEGLVQRVTQTIPESVFEILLQQIHANSHWTVVRGQPAIRRIEIVALLGVPGKVDPEILTSKAPLHLVEIPKEAKADPPQVKAYIELGDLDYPTLLKEEFAVKDVAPPATGEILMHGLKEGDDATKFRAVQLLEEMTGKVKGGASATADDLVKVKGQGDAQDAVTRIAGSGAEGAAEVTTVKGGTAAADAGNYTLKSYSTALPPDPREINRSGLKASGQEQEETSEDEEGGDEESGSRIKEVLDKVKSAWPFRFGKKKEEDAEEEEDPEGEEGTAEATDVPEEKPAAKAEESKKAQDIRATKDAVGAPVNDEDEDGSTAPLPPTKPIVISNADIAKQALKLTNDIESGIEKTVDRAQAEAGELKKEMGSTRAKRWVDGLMTELVAEKAHLAEASKALNSSIKQKEIEFRTKEQILTEELRRRDDMIRQKTNALNRAKDQLSQVAISAERLKSAKAGAADDAHYKQKYLMAQKLLTSAKDENSQLNGKVEDLKNQVMNVQLNSSKRSGPSTTDFAALQSKYERSIRQMEEFKKTNQALLDKLSEAKKERSGAPQDDMKKRLEAAMKMVTGHQRDSEKLQIRVEEMQREQMRLQAELNKTTQDLKSARFAGRAAQGAVGTSALAGAKPAAPGAKPVTAAPAASSASQQAAKTAALKSQQALISGKAPAPAAAARPAAPGGTAKPLAAATASKPAAPPATAKPPVAATASKPAAAGSKKAA